jgi:hypothetical protein
MNIIQRYLDNKIRFFSYSFKTKATSKIYSTIHTYFIIDSTIRITINNKEVSSKEYTINEYDKTIVFNKYVDKGSLFYIEYKYKVGML